VWTSSIPPPSIHYGIARIFKTSDDATLSTIENVSGQHATTALRRPQPVEAWVYSLREVRAPSWAEAGLRGAKATVGSLPYGLQKASSFVRALMAKLRLLLLDEPVAGLIVRKPMFCASNCHHLR
jgi:ABC-type branched-subunit amino acid transport system ATPase component